MGFLDKLGESIKDTTKNVAKSIQTSQEIRQSKLRMLERFTISDLKKICNTFGIGEPQPFDSFGFTTMNKKNVLVRDDYINHVIAKLTLNQIRHYAENNGIKVIDSANLGQIKSGSSFFQQKVLVEEATQKEQPEVTTIQVKQQPEFDSILSTIYEEFEPLKIRNEKELELQLFQFLRVKYPKRVESQCPSPSGKVDILIDGKYALEIKLAENKGTLENLFGQANKYKKVYSQVAVIILDVGKVERPFIKEIMNDIEEKLGVKTLVLDGVLGKKKGSSKEINIRLK